MSFWEPHIYRIPTRGRFNMCNGTHTADLGPGTKKIALDPAESSATDGGKPVGAGPAA